MVCGDVVPRVLGGWRERFERRVSWRPGAEGADGVVAVEGVRVVRLVVEVGWAVEGTRRRDWRERISWVCR